MKVIHQLIHYFHARGALTDSQMEYLRRQGFWPEFACIDILDDEEDRRDEAPAGKAEIATFAFPREDPPPRRTRRGAATGGMPDARELCRRLNGLTACWNGAAAIQHFQDFRVQDFHSRVRTFIQAG